MQDYRKLTVWQKSHKLAIETYAISPNLRAPEAWPIRDQVLRAAISVPSNIAEGAGRERIPIFGDSSSIPWVPATNLSMICFLRGTSSSCPLPRIRGSWDNWRKSGVC